MIFGMAVFLAGILLERRRRRRKFSPDELARYPDIDLNDAARRAGRRSSRSPA